MGLLGSAFGRALSGAGEAAQQLARRYIDDEILRNREEAFADLRVRTAGTIREQDDAFKNDPTRVARDRQRTQDDTVAARETARQQAPLDAQTAREVEAARLNDGTLNEAARKKAADDAAAAAKSKNDQTKAEASDEQLLAARAKIELSDPKVAQEIARSKASISASEASAGAAAASARQSNAQTAGIELANEDKKRWNGLHDQLSSVLADKTITDPKVRAEKMAPIQQQIEMMRAKGGGGGAKQSEGGTLTKEWEQDGAKYTLKTGANGAAVQQADPYAVKPGEKPAAKPAPAKPIMDAAKERVSADPIATMSDSDLRRIAAIEGHANQAKAQAELARRSQGKTEVDTTGFGYGGR